MRHFCYRKKRRQYQPLAPTFMAVPNQTIFGVDENEASINYRTVRQITDEDRLIILLKLRIEVFFIGQVKPLETVSPFPLSVMTCIGVETLGEITIAESSDDNGIQFKKILGKFDTNLAKTLTKAEKELVKKKLARQRRRKNKNSDRPILQILSKYDDSRLSWQRCVSKVRA